MKITLVYLFLLTYASVMFKPVMPYVSDAVAHVLFFKDHMLTVHAHNGKKHVHAEIAEGAKNDQQNNTTNNLKKTNFDSEHILTQIYTSTSSKTRSDWKIILSIPICTAFINPHYLPPRA